MRPIKRPTTAPTKMIDGETIAKIMFIKSQSGRVAY
jgi:hypothetical protein